MNAIVIKCYGGPEVLEFGTRPDVKPAKGEVLVRVAAASVNPFDQQIRFGAMKDSLPLTFPAILGVDVSGTVAELGEGVTGFAIGDSVFAHATQTYAELCLVKASDLAKLPEGIDLMTAAALPTVTTTGSQLANLALGTLGRDQLVLVTGAVGNVGRTAIYVAKQAGATVYAGVLKHKVQDAEALGVDQVIALDDDLAMKRLPELDAVANTIGGPTGNALIAKIRSQGVFATVQAPPSEAVNHPQIVVRTMQTVADSESLISLTKAYVNQQITIPLGERFALRDAAKAHAAAEAGSKGNFCWWSKGRKTKQRG